MASSRRAVLALLAVAAAVGAQTSPREEPKPSSVVGVVTDALTGVPLPKAHVAFEVPGNPKARRFGAITTAEGKFSIGPIDPGAYRVTADRPGFVASGPSVTVRIGPGDAVKDIELKLAPHAVIAGRVVDAHGDPVERAKVEAVRGGSRAEQMTDARGEFRLSGLRAGKYIVRARPRDERDQEIRPDGSPDENYGVTYYPGTRSEREAAVVDTRAGGETGGIEIRLARAPVVRISGKIMGTPECVAGYHLRRTDVRYASDMGLKGPQFALWRLPSGKSSLRAGCRDLNGRWLESAYVEFESGDANLDGFDLQAMLPFEVSGRVDWGGWAPAAGEPSKPGLRGQSLILWRESVEVPLAEDGTFRIPKALPGRYHVELTGLPENLYVKSVRQGSVEMPNQGVDLRLGPGGPITVLLGAQGAQISGVVQDEKGPVTEVSVGLVGDEPLEFDLFRRVETGADGSFAFRGLAPGKYLVFVFDTEDYEALRKYRSLPFYAQPGEKVEVREGENVTRNLKPAR